MSKSLLILMILISANAFAGINKWVDGQGRVHYSDQAPPPDAQGVQLRSAAESATAASGVDDTPTTAQREADLKRQEMDKQAASDRAAVKQAADDALKINCDNAQQDLLALQSGARMMTIGADGQRSYIDDTERQQRIAKAQSYIGANCKF